MNIKVKFLFIMVLILLTFGCKKKKLKVIKIPTGPDIYFKDNDNAGDGTTFEENLENTFTKQDTSFYTYEKYHYLTFNKDYQYIEGTDTKTSTAIIDNVLNLTYIYSKAKKNDDGTDSLGDGIFIVLTNEILPPTDAITTEPTEPTAPPTLPEKYVYTGISIKSGGRSLYITDTFEDIDFIDWSYNIIADSRERSLEDMWLKNAQDNRVEELTIENSARIIKDTYLMVYIYNTAVTPLRAVYKGHNTAYYIGIELTRAGKNIYLSYDINDIMSGSIITSPDEIDWSDMTFVGYTKRIEGPITTAPSSLRKYDIFEPEFD